MLADDLDFEDTLRLAVEERVSLSPDALTGMEQNLRFLAPIFRKARCLVVCRPGRTGSSFAKTPQAARRADLLWLTGTAKLRLAPHLRPSLPSPQVYPIGTLFSSQNSISKSSSHPRSVIRPLHRVRVRNLNLQLRYEA